MGVLPGSLYHHFRSKEEMLHDIVKPFLRHSIDVYREIARRGDSPTVTMRHLVHAGLVVSLREPATHSILLHQWDIVARSRKFSYVVRGWIETRQLWLDVIRAGVRAGEFREGLDVRLTADLVLEQISSTVLWSRFRPGTPIAEVARRHVDLLMGGLLRH